MVHHGLLRPCVLRVFQGCELIIHAVISGHSHKPAEYRRNGVLYLNPGSAGPGRFNLPVSAALMEIDGETINISFVNLLDYQI